MFVLVAQNPVLTGSLSTIYEVIGAGLDFLEEVSILIRRSCPEMLLWTFSSSFVGTATSANTKVGASASIEGERDR